MQKVTIFVNERHMVYVFLRVPVCTGFQEGAVYYVGYFSLKERLISEKYKVP